MRSPSTRTGDPLKPAAVGGVYLLLVTACTVAVLGAHANNTAIVAAGSALGLTCLAVLVTGRLLRGRV